MHIFLIWLLVMFVAIAFLAILLFIPNYVSAYRHLKRAGAPNPSLIIWKRILGTFLRRKQQAGYMLADAHEAERLKDMIVWLDWDIRWVAAGTCLGKVQGIVEKPDDMALKIQLFTPIRFVGDEDEVCMIIYEPNSSTSFIKRNKFFAIRGVLKTPNESSWFKRGALSLVSWSVWGKHCITRRYSGSPKKLAPAQLFVVCGKNEGRKGDNGSILTLVGNFHVGLQ